MWMANVVLAPVGIWLTIKATRDSALFDTDAYIRFFKRLGNKKA
jgi:lipopolysaccharide export system permease protein